ncbi:ATP-binding protein [Kitasatospora sp. NPDC059571]|uniref:ATP-binding protein n=1 Tax=Kitasatospora sp. NPDC059571 TaxID=3346871 RepID=UPI0036BD273F
MLVLRSDHPEGARRPLLPRSHRCACRETGELEFYARIRVAPAGESARDLRNAAADLLCAWGSGDLVDTVKLLLSEIFTNAVRHAATGPSGTPGRIRATLCQSRDSLTVNVEDPGSGLPSVRFVRDPGPDAENGRGLLLLEALASAWGTRTTRRGKTVWFALRRA